MAEQSFSSKSRKANKIDYKSLAYWFERLYDKNVSIYGYKVTPSDFSSLKKIAMTFRKMSLNPEIHLKSFLEWSIENREMIISHKNGFFIISDLHNYINHYLQDFISKGGKDVAQVAIPYDSQFIKRIKKVIDDGISFKDLLALYGIPITSTYLVSRMNKDSRVVKANVRRAVSTLISENPDIAIEAIKKSISMSPYPPDFEMLNWREDLSDIISKLNIIKNKWWMNIDYQGIPPKHYEEILDA